jgi:hypothetical protein
MEDRYTMSSDGYMAYNTEMPLRFADWDYTQRKESMRMAL